MDLTKRPARRNATILALGLVFLTAGCDSPDDGFMNIVSARFLQAEGDLVEAEKAYLRATSSLFLDDERRSEARVGLAGLYEEQARWGQAADLVELVVAAQRKTEKGAHAGDVRWLAELRWKQGRKVEARQILASAMDEFPIARPVYLAVLAGFHREEGNCDEAHRLFRAAMADRPTIYVEERLAPLLEEMGRHAEAADIHADLELRLRSRVPLPGDSHYSVRASEVADFLRDRGRDEEALALRLAVVKAKACGCGDARRAARDAYLKAGRHAEAELLYVTRADLTENDVLLDELLDVYVAAGKLVEAEKLAREVVESHEPPPLKAVPRNSVEALLRYAFEDPEEDEGRDARLELARDEARLVRVLLLQQRLADADEPSARVLATVEGDLAPHHPRVAEALELRAQVVRGLGRDGDADALAARAANVRRMHAKGPQTARRS